MRKHFLRDTATGLYLAQQRGKGGDAAWTASVGEAYIGDEAATSLILQLEILREGFQVDRVTAGPYSLEAEAVRVAHVKRQAELLGSVQVTVYLPGNVKSTEITGKLSWTEEP